jgi:hypothetical protein
MWRRRAAAWLVLVPFFLLLAAGFHAQSRRPEGLAATTPAEDAQYTRYSLHDVVARYLQAVDRASRQATVTPIGMTVPAKDFPPTALYLCVITAEGADKPTALNRTKPTVLVIASQHGDEQSGKEAALQLIRDLALGSLKPLLKKANFLVVPQANPYGNWINRRQNEQGLDLNRDHVKLEAPETRALHAVFRAWMPEVTLDVHEKGDDYYRVSTGCVSNINIDPAIEAFSRNILFPAVEKGVAAAGFTWHEYLVTEAMGSTEAAGSPDRPEAEPPREMMTRYSTTDLNDGRNSFGIYETLSFIQEGASRHDVETLKARTAWQYAGIKALAEAVVAHAGEVVDLVRGRRTALLRTATAYGLDNMVHLRMDYVRDPKQPELVLRQFETQTAEPAGQPSQITPRVVTEVVRNWFPRVEPRVTVPRPLGYLVPSAYGAVVRTLVDHGVSLGIVTADTQLAVESQRITAIVPSADDYVAPPSIEVERRMARVVAHKGDLFVFTAQPAASLIPSLLEPQSEFGLIRYRSYGLLPEVGAIWPFSRIVATGQLPLAPFLPAAPPK